MTVAEVDALLYLPGHPRQQLLRALRIPALSPGWQASFRALLDAEPGSGNAGLAAASPPPAWPGFRPLTVTAIERESDAVISIRLEAPDGAPLPPARPGQFLTLRIRARRRRAVGAAQLLAVGPARRRPLPHQRQARARRRGERLPARHGSRSATSSTSRRRAGTFILDRSDAPVLLVSAGIGATPVLAMLHALAAEHAEREVWWLHGARSGRDHCFAAEARTLLASLPNVRAHVFYSRPGPAIARAATSTAPAG